MSRCFFPIHLQDLHPPQGRLFHALQDVSLDIEEGEFFGLLGPNGAGKTTLISILAGLARASSGRVTVLGHDVQGDFAAARQRLGIVPQELVFDPFSMCARPCASSRATLASATTMPGSTSCWKTSAWPTRPAPTCASCRVA